MILVSIFTFLFIIGYRKLFPHQDGLKRILAVTVFSVLFSFLISFLPVYGFFSAYNSSMWEATRTGTALSTLSMPFRWEMEFEPIAELDLPQDDFLFSRLFFAHVKLLEMKFCTGERVGGRVIYPSGEDLFNCMPSESTIDCTIPLFLQLLLIFTALNMIGAPLSAFAYKLTEKIV